VKVSLRAPGGEEVEGPGNSSYVVSIQNIIRTVKSRRMRWARFVAYMKRIPS
jgi:hypothetical protein